MNRREAFLALGCAGISSLLPAAAAEALASEELSVEQVEGLLRSLAGVEPRPGEAAQIREALKAPRATGDSDPRVQPALGFNPEVEL